MVAIKDVPNAIFQHQVPLRYLSVMAENFSSLLQV